MSDAAFDSIFPCREENMTFGEYFTSQSYLNMPNTEGVMVASVTLELGCRNNWHVHHASRGDRQILLYTVGSGQFQAEGETPVSLEPGSIMITPANRKHWHGVKKDSWFSHITIEVPGEGTSSEWCGPVSNEYYENL